MFAKPHLLLFICKYKKYCFCKNFAKSRVNMLFAMISWSPVFTQYVLLFNKNYFFCAHNLILQLLCKEECKLTYSFSKCRSYKNVPSIYFAYSNNYSNKIALRLNLEKCYFVQAKNVQNLYLLYTIFLLNCVGCLVGIYSVRAFH